MSATTQSTTRPVVTKALRLRWHHVAGCCGGRTMSKWEAEKAERNRRSIARLTKSLPGIFPSAVLSRALGRPFVPPTPRLAIDSYWGAHPLRADRLACALAARSGAPTGWGLAARGQSQEWLADHIQNAPSALPRTRIRTGSRILSCMRATGLSLRLARRPMERWPKQECDLALRLCGRMAILDCSE